MNSMCRDFAFSVVVEYVARDKKIKSTLQKTKNSEMLNTVYTIYTIYCTVYSMK